MKNIKFNPLFFVALIIVYLTNNLFSFTIMYITLVIHELVHLYFMCKNKIILDKITIEPFGISFSVTAKFENPIIFLSAPIFNIILGIALYAYGIYTKSTFLSYFIISNMTIGFINLIPCLPLDGGRALEIAISNKHSKSKATKILSVISLVCSILLIFIGVNILYISNFNFSVILIGLFLLYNTLAGKKMIENNKITDISNRDKMGKFKEIMPIITIGVDENYQAHKLIKKFKDDSYYIINIIKNGVIIKQLTETQILSAIINSKNNIRLKEIY